MLRTEAHPAGWAVVVGLTDDDYDEAEEWDHTPPRVVPITVAAEVGGLRLEALQVGGGLRVEGLAPSREWDSWQFHDVMRGETVRLGACRVGWFSSKEDAEKFAASYEG